MISGLPKNEEFFKHSTDTFLDGKANKSNRNIWMIKGVG